MSDAIRRVVTGHDADGRAVVRSDERIEPMLLPSGDAALARLWSTETVPADNNGTGEETGPAAAVPIERGSVLWMVELMPGRASAPHRTHSIDYGIVLSGRIELVLIDGATVALAAGDIVVQRGTMHLWRNPSATEPARVAFVLVEARPVVIGGEPLPVEQHALG
jgi:quercetin dioxygenase-like cupin family protein